MDIPFVFVHLGKNPSPQLTFMAVAAKKLNPSVELYLITDHPKFWQDFPGMLIVYDKSKREEFISNLAKKNKDMEEIAGGYWFFTFERLYALESIYSKIGPDQAFLHFESDVLPMFLHQDLNLFTDRKLRTAVPRFSRSRGIASVLYSPSQEDFKRFLRVLNNYLTDRKQKINDMELLGSALNDGQIDELPTLPKDAWIDADGKRLIFDGAAIGQYLFGQDPFHTGGRRISGFINPEFESNLQSWKWEITSNVSQPPLLKVNAESTDLRVLNLHLHSKIILSEPNFGKDWTRAINEANSIVERVAGEYTPNSIHTSRISIKNRFRLALRTGLIRSIVAYLIRRIKRIIRSYNSE
jgi:hypothetical protein